MQDQFHLALEHFQDSLSVPQGRSAIVLTAYMILGGCLAIYVRFLYRKCSASASDTDSITRVFPLLVVVTTAVIGVVKGSLALSLGLVGALSIVRFRAAIKDPEELVYLFLCIAIGLALGAELPYLAVGLVFAATLFVVGMHLRGHGARVNNLLLSIRGDARLFDGDENGVLAVVESLAGRYSLHRFDIEGGRGQMRIALGRLTSGETGELIVRLRQRLPECEFSYVNMNTPV